MKKAAIILLMLTTFCTLVLSNNQCMGKVINYSDRYGQLTILKIYGGGKNPDGGYFQRRADCLCDCGNYCNVSLGKIHNGITRSCGCLRIKVRSKIGGLSSHKLAKVRLSMISRCYNKSTKSYKNYGGRGISVCDEWRQSSLSFIKWGIENGWSDGLTLDRINNDGNYEPSNCRFVTSQAQQNNRQDTLMFTVDGVTKSLADWARFYNMPHRRLVWLAINKKKDKKDFAYHLINPNVLS